MKTFNLSHVVLSALASTPRGCTAGINPNCVMTEEFTIQILCVGGMGGGGGGLSSIDGTCASRVVNTVVVSRVREAFAPILGNPPRGGAGIRIVSFFKLDLLTGMRI